MKFLHNSLHCLFKINYLKVSVILEYYELVSSLGSWKQTLVLETSFPSFHVFFNSASNLVYFSPRRVIPRAMKLWIQPPSTTTNGCWKDVFFCIFSHPYILAREHCIIKFLCLSPIRPSQSATSCRFADVLVCLPNGLKARYKHHLFPRAPFMSLLGGQL